MNVVAIVSLLRRTPHLREVAAGKSEDVDPIGAVDDKLDERLERIGDNSRLAVR
ncbi:hypothetical protein [Bradyrhizobium sp. 192]|uniref:hypothetical protein n=1 Tax=Bradyrhizobium sp. 192 TaxID=2782660 RepID=UPI001FFE82BB|nr:hypothetical protein [Bradyrhizobium sp. 192]UPJ59418.1 hypothetical protein IVB24_06300 [Bradyrhizobium sp. 192]